MHLLSCHDNVRIYKTEVETKEKEHPKTIQKDAFNAPGNHSNTCESGITRRLENIK